MCPIFSSRVVFLASFVSHITIFIFKTDFFFYYTHYIFCNIRIFFLCINTPITLPVFIMLRLCDILPDFLNFYIHDKNLFMVILLDVVIS